MVAQRPGVVAGAVLGHGALALLERALLALEFLREPGEALAHVLLPDVEVLRHVFVSQGIDRFRGGLGIRSDERHVHQAAGAHRLHRHTRGELRDEAFARRRRGPDRGRPRERTEPGTRGAAHAGHDARDAPPRRLGSVQIGEGAEVERLQHALGQLTAGEDAVLRLEVRLGVVGVLRRLGRAAHALHGERPLVLELDEQARGGAVQRRAGVRLQRRGCDHQHEHAGGRPLVAQEGAQLVEQMRVGRPRGARGERGVTDRGPVCTCEHVAAMTPVSASRRPSFVYRLREEPGLWRGSPSCAVASGPIDRGMAGQGS